MKETGKFGLGDEFDCIGSTDAANTAFDADETSFHLSAIPRRNVETYPEQYIAVPAVPAPPEHLRTRVGGHADVAGYLRTGHLMARSIFELIRSRTIAVRENARVLDFGCGTGRLTTWLRGRHSGWDLYGTDVDAEAIAWAQKNLTNVARFACNLVAPPLSYWDGFFDVVAALSVFTQPEDDLQSAWLEELVRVTRPGGHLIVSVAEHHDVQSGPKLRARSADGTTRERSSFYRTNHLATDFIRHAWGKFAQIEQIIPRWLGQNQSLVICRK